MKNYIVYCLLKPNMYANNTINIFIRFEKFRVKHIYINKINITAFKKKYLYIYLFAHIYLKGNRFSFWRKKDFDLFLSTLSLRKTVPLFDPFCYIVLWANYTVILYNKIVVHANDNKNLRISIKYFYTFIK